MKYTIKFLIIIFFVGNINVYSQSQSEKVSEFFNKANAALLKMPKVEITYSWSTKPLLSPEIFSSKVHLSVDRSLQNNDSVSGFTAEYGDWFQYFLNNEMCSGGSDSIVMCRSTDTIEYTNNNELIRSAMRVYRPFVRSKPFKIDEEELLYYSIQEIIINGEDCTRLIRLDSGEAAKYDSTILDFRNKDFLLVKIRNAIYSNEVDAIQIREFDSIQFKQNNELDLLAIREKITNGYRQKYYDPYSSAKDEPEDTTSILPDFELTDVNGNNFSSRSLKTKYALVDFSYTSCFYCIKAIPGLSKINERFRNDLSVFMINPYDLETKNYCDSVFKKRGINYPIYFLDRRTSKIKLTVHAFPTIFLVEMPSMKIVERYTGFTEEVESKMIADIERVIQK